MAKVDCVRRVLDSDRFRARERWYAEWLPATLVAVEREWDRGAAANAVQSWGAAHLVAAAMLLKDVVVGYFDRAEHFLSSIGRHIRLSTPQPIVYAVDFEMWRDQWAVRSVILVPEWERQVLRQQHNTLRLYARLDLLAEEVRRRLDAWDLDLLLGTLFNRSDAYGRTMKHLLGLRGSHPDDLPRSGDEEKKREIGCVLATGLAEAEDEPVPALSPQRLNELQVHPDVLRDLQSACRIAVHQRTMVKGRIDRRDEGFLLRTLDGQHCDSYLKRTVKDSLARQRRDANAQKRAPKEGGRCRDSLDEILDGDVTSSTYKLQRALVRTLREKEGRERYVVDRLLDLDMRTLALKPKLLDLLRMMLKSGIVGTTHLADLAGVSRQTMHTRKAQLEAALKCLGLQSNSPD